MGRQPFPAKQPCPCGSRKSYERCCITKPYHFYVDDETGDVYQGFPLDPDVREALEAQRKKFIAKFGRDPGPNDDVFFDLDEDELRKNTIAAMRAAGIKPAFIHAYERTGLIVTTDNRELMSPEDIFDWDDAVAEYYELHPNENSRVD